MGKHGRTNAIVINNSMNQFVEEIYEGYVTISQYPCKFSRKHMNKILSNTASWAGKYLTITTD